MWPKLLAQLFELLPHITRLVPMADRYFASKANDNKLNEAALQAMAEGVRGDLGQVTKAHVGLYRQLQELSAQVTSVQEEAKPARAMVDHLTRRVDAMDEKVEKLGTWIKLGMSLMVGLLLVVVWLVSRR